MKRDVMLGLLAGVIAAGAFAENSEGVFSLKLGQFEIHMMVERSNTGNAGILVGANDALKSRYIPASGFTHSTNTFLVKTKTPERTIVIDTGFGGAIFDRMKSLGVDPAQVDAVLLTHMHGDHIGGLQKDGKPLFPRAKVYVEAKDVNYFTKTAVNQGAVAALAAYGANVTAFDAASFAAGGREILPGVKAAAAYGHTPGHTVYLLESGGAKFVIAGDFLHVALVQFPRPDISATYDTDKNAAAASRREVLEYTAKNKILIGGMHMVYPAVGNVEADGNGFRFVPAK